jgi:methylated-DNA-[protein]-cysteine S-methyltransferase
MNTIFIMPIPTNQIDSIHAGRINSKMTFDEKVWAITTRIPKGKVATYAWVARQMGSNGYRAVGRALNRNPYAPKVPCHRVVGSNGTLTGFAGGLKAKQELLSNEGIEMVKGKVDLRRFAVQ